MIKVENIKDNRWDKIDNLLDIGFLKDGVWLAGGSLRTLVDTLDVIKDFDLFFKTKELAKETEDLLCDYGFNVVFRCPEGHLVTLYRTEGNVKTKVQLVTKFYYESMEQLIKSFDIIACCCAYDGETLVFNNDWIKDIRKKRVTLNVINYPVATINRMMKYRNKGYYIPKETLETLVLDINMKNGADLDTTLYID